MHRNILLFFVISCLTLVGDLYADAPYAHYSCTDGRCHWIFDLEQRSESGDICTATIVAGNGTAGSSGDGGPATAASIYPLDIELDSAGRLYIAEGRDYNRIRRINEDGTITTVAGNGSAGFSGDGGPATSAQLNDPVGLAFDSGGRLYISDSLNGRIRRVNIDGDGKIETIAGLCYGCSSTNGVLAVNSGIEPGALAVDASDNLFIAETVRNQVKKIDSSTGIITKVAGREEVAYEGDHLGNSLVTYGGESGPATDALIDEPYDIEVDSGGNLFISTLHMNYVMKVDASTNTISRVAGRNISDNSGCGAATDGVAATETRLCHTYGIAIDSAGNLFVTHSNGGESSIKKVSADSRIISTFFKIPTERDIEVGKTGEMYLIRRPDVLKITCVPPPPPPCNCGEWRDGFCGTGGCAPGEKLQKRDCSPDACEAETQCVSATDYCRNADLGISMSGTRTPDFIRYRIKVKNNGPATAREVSVDDLLPPYQRLYQSSGNCVFLMAYDHYQNIIRCSNPSDIPPSGEWSFYLDATYNAGYLDAGGSTIPYGTYRNSASVHSITRDPGPASNTALLPVPEASSGTGGAKIKLPGFLKKPSLAPKWFFRK